MKNGDIPFINKWHEDAHGLGLSYNNLLHLTVYSLTAMDHNQVSIPTLGSSLNWVKPNKCIYVSMWEPLLMHRFKGDL